LEKREIIEGNYAYKLNRGNIWVLRRWIEIWKIQGWKEIPAEQHKAHSPAQRKEDHQGEFA